MPNNNPKKPVDVSPWVEAYELMLRGTKQTCTHEMLEHLRGRLLGMGGTERKVFIAWLKRDPAYHGALLEVHARMYASMTARP